MAFRAGEPPFWGLKARFWDLVLVWVGEPFSGLKDPFLGCGFGFKGTPKVYKVTNGGTPFGCGLKGTPKDTKQPTGEPLLFLFKGNSTRILSNQLGKEPLVVFV